LGMEKRCHIFGLEVKKKGSYLEMARNLMKTPNVFSQGGGWSFADEKMLGKPKIT